VRFRSEKCQSERRLDHLVSVVVVEEVEVVGETGWVQLVGAGLGVKTNGDGVFVGEPAEAKFVLLVLRLVDVDEDEDDAAFVATVLEAPGVTSLVLAAAAAAAADGAVGCRLCFRLIPLEIRARSFSARAKELCEISMPSMASESTAMREREREREREVQAGKGTIMKNVELESRVSMR
jgi:hypothetical protein